MSYTRFSMLDVMNAALVSQGFEEIVSMNDGSDEWRLLARNWPIIVEAELEAGLYEFTRKQAFLQTRQDGQFGYRDGYAVPGDALHVRLVWTETEGVRDIDIPWSQGTGYVYVDCAEGVWCEYVVAADPGLWSANFTLGVQKKLEAVLARAKESYGDMAAMEQMAEDAFDKARKVSSRSRQATPHLRTSRFARARFTRGS